jgi:integrase
MRESVPKQHQRRDFTTEIEANTFATKLNACVLKKNFEELDSETFYKLKRLAKQLETESILEPQTWYGKNLSDPLEEIMAAGVMFIKTLDEANTLRRQKGLSVMSPIWANEEFKRRLKAKTKAETAPLFSKLIKECVTHKTSEYGGQGNRNLEPTTKREWTKLLGEYVSQAIGSLSTETDQKTLVAAVRNVINQGVEQRSELKQKLGKAWSPRYKNKIAKKASEFGIWCVENEYLGSNPFKALPKKFQVKTERRNRILQVRQVQKLFEVIAANKKYRKMVPYFSLLFFSGLRPSEIADPKARYRRLNWEHFDRWERNSEVTDGVRFEVVAEDHDGRRMSKSNIDRTADLTPNGVAWIKWALGELPNEGEVYYDRDLVKAIRQDADLWGNDSKGKLKWAPDVARHSMASYADQNSEFKVKMIGYWNSCLGHAPAVYKKHYEGRVEDQKERTAYFNIFPPKEKDPNKGQGQ